jgi:hypothetical protein
MNTGRSPRRTTVYKVQLYGIFVVAIGWLSLLHVLGYVRLLRHQHLVGPLGSSSSPAVGGINGSSRRTAVAPGSHRKDTSSALLIVQQFIPPTLENTNQNNEQVSFTGAQPMRPPHGGGDGDGGWGIYQLLALSDTKTVPISSPGTDDEGDTMMIPEETNLSPPQTTLLDYMHRHSAAALRRDSPEAWRQRRFAIAYYSCPHQLGNRLFHFLNNVLWAVITDRTILYQYLDRETCERLRLAQPMLYLDHKICQAANTKADCNAVLERASWLPSYNEFADPAWDSAAIYQVDFWQTHWFKVSEDWIRKRYPYDESKHANMTKVDQLDDAKLVEFPALTNSETTMLAGRFTRQELLGTTDARMTARKLVNKGLRYTYGMLLTEMFRLRHDQVDLVKEYYPKPAATGSTNNNDEIFSIALHSRHKHVKQKGRNIQNEKDCLNKVLVHRAVNQPCQVCTMSDRPATLAALQDWLEQEHHCQVIQVNHSVSTTSFSKEHGPNAGVGFARELDVCHRYGRNAVVTTSTGSGASSSALLEALAAYHHHKGYGDGSSGYDNDNNKTTEAQYCNAYST